MKKQTLTPEMEKSLTEIQSEPAYCDKDVFLAGIEYQKENTMPFILIVLLSAIGAICLLLIVSLFFKDPMFTDDYKTKAENDTYYKMVAMKDSALRNVNNDKICNRYIDSANKYSDIHNYILN